MTTLYSILSIASTLFALAALVYAVVQRRLADRNPLAALIAERFPPDPQRGSQVLLGLTLGTISILLPLLFYALAGWVHIFWVGWDSLLLIGLAGVTAIVKLIWVFFEELIFRGALLPLLNRWLAVGWALLIAAFVFAFGHFSRGVAPPDFFSLLVLALDGLAFGLLFLATGGLWMPLGWHFAKNLLVWLVYGETSLQFTAGLLRVGFTGPPLWVGAPGQAGLADVLVTLALTGLAWWFYRSSRNGSQEPQPKSLKNA